MIFKGRSPDNETCFQNPQSCPWLVVRSNQFGPPKFKLNTLTPKTHLADMLTKGNFTRDEWNHLLCLFNISHSSSAECSEVMSKRTQKELGEERVTAKSRPMMNLIAWSSERVPSALSSTASKSPRKIRYDSQTPLSPQTEKYDRTGWPVVCSEGAHRPVENAHSSDRTGRPVVCPQRGAPQFVIEDDEPESDLSLGSRSFLDRVSAEKTKAIFDECHRRQRRTFCHIENVNVFNIASICIHMEKNLLRQLAFYQKY